MIKLILLFVLLFLPLKGIATIGFIQPPAEVFSLVTQLAYPDFPAAADILSIIRIESGFNPKAINKNSQGIMQVNEGPWDVAGNMHAGVNLLREYYIRTGSAKAAIVSYNVGIDNYFRSRLRGSQLEYLLKFNKVRRGYEVSYEKHRLDQYKSMRGWGMLPLGQCSLHRGGTRPPYSGVFILYGLSRKGLRF
jgi:hypothetical protein